MLFYILMLRKGLDKAYLLYLHCCWVQFKLSLGSHLNGGRFNAISN